MARRNVNNIIMMGLIPPLVVSIVFLVLLLFKNLENNEPQLAQEDVQYLHDVYKFEEATTDDIDAYYTRHDVNAVIEELGVSQVVTFFNQYTNDTFVSVVIIQEAMERQIPVNVAFSLAWRESQFNTFNVSPKNRNGSRDWGLFQLNDTYYKWSRDEFFDIEKNVAAGVAHLEYCLDEMEDIQLALAAYNAGVHGVRTYGIPASTERHVNVILEYEDQINREFNEWLDSRS